MKTKTLTEYVEHQLAMCRVSPDEVFLTSAFGAVEYHLWMWHEDNEKIYNRWENKWKPEFEKLIWGNKK